MDDIYFDKTCVKRRWSQLTGFVRKTLEERDRPRGNAKDILLLTHNNPDPDTIAAACGLKTLLMSIGVSSRVAYSGIIGRPENRAMVELLKLDLSKADKLARDAYPMAALIDTQPGTGNNCLPDARIPDIVFDHHIRREVTKRVPFVEVYTDVGSTSTIITHYIMSSGIKLSRKLATALYYGIITDTQDLGRHSNEADLLAVRFLFPKVLHKTMAKIQKPRIPVSYFRELVTALTMAVIFDDVVVVDAGRVSTPDTLAQIVDFLIRVEHIKWVLCMGEIDGELDFSIRTDYHGRKAGQVARCIARELGSAGGHDMTAGGQIHLAGGDSANKIKEKLVRRFLEQLEKDVLQAESLLSDPFCCMLARTSFKGEDKPLG